MSLKVRWITWWPAPYWEPRFEALNDIEYIDLKVYYIQKASTIHQWEENNNRDYSYEILSDKLNDEIGYKIRFSQLSNVFSALKIFKEKTDVIILPYADIRFIAIILLCILTRRKYFLFCANTIIDERHYSVFKTILKKLIFVNATAVLATGIAQKEYSLKHLVHEQKVKIVGNPSIVFQDAPRIKYDDTSIIASGLVNEIILLYVGRLSREKGLYDLLSSISLLLNSKYQFKIILVGDGPEKEGLKQFSIKNNVNCVFTGFISDISYLQMIYQLSDVFVLPSYCEPWGLVVNEAMQNNLPIILSDKIGCKKMLLQEGRNGYCFKSGDARDLSNKIKLMVDKGKRSRMGQESYKIIQTQNPEIWAKKIKNAISNYI